jgi:concanavalin A-like lectin/glucanase superfamily protein
MAMKPSSVIVAGVSGLLVLGLVVKHFSGSDLEKPAGPRKAVESLASRLNSDRAGWQAREGSESPDQVASAAGSPHFGAGRDGGPGSKSGSAGGRDQVGSDRGAGGWRGAGGTGSERQGGGSAVLGGGGSSGSDAIRAGATLPDVTSPTGSGGSKLSGGGRQGTGASDVREVVPAGEKPKDSTEDPNAPVLTLFDKTPQAQSTADQNPDPVESKGVDCNSSPEGCTFDTNAKYALPDAGNLSGEQGTISFCLQPQWNGADATNADLVDLHTPNQWENHLKVFKNNDYLRFSVWPNSGVESGAATKITNWQPNQWHHVSVTWGQDPNTGANDARLFVDGSLVGHQTYDGQIEVPQGVPLFIGSDYPQGEPGAQASLSKFQGYRRAMAPDEVASLSSDCPQQ